MEIHGDVQQLVTIRLDHFPVYIDIPVNGERELIEVFDMLIHADRISLHSIQIADRNQVRLAKIYLFYFITQTIHLPSYTASHS